LKLSATTNYQITAALNAEDGFTSLFVGRGDSLVYDKLSRGIRIDGRDLSAGLQDSPSNDVFPNVTSSEIVTQVALRHALIPMATQTMNPVGRYYHDETCQISYSQFNRITTEWDLLTFLARCENFDLFVRGRQLFFQPATPISPPMFSIRPENLITLRLKRYLQMSGDIAVTVKSWNSKANRAVSQTAISRPVPAKVEADFVFTAVPLHYNIIQPNLSEEKASRVAQIRVGELSRHEQSIECTMPGELDLTPRDSFTLEGTESIFDRQYQIDKIDRTISPSTGFIQRLFAHSISTREVVLSGEVS
jgi:phage protein D